MLIVENFKFKFYSLLINVIKHMMIKLPLILSS